MNKGRRIVFDEDGLIAEGEDVARDIASKSGDYTERIELVNMPPDLLERFEVDRERRLGEVAKPKPTGLVGFFGLE
jgi:hypothetical protein